MDTKEKHVKENESNARRVAEENTQLHTPDQIADSMPAEGSNRHRHSVAKSNRLWLWLGVIVLVFILIYWLFTIGVFEDIVGTSNG